MWVFIRSLAGMPGRVAAVATTTFTQLVRMRLFLVAAVFAIGFLGLQFIPFHQHLGIEFQGVQQLQLLRDIAMGCMQLFGLIFCVAATALLLPRDTEDRILYTILCKPVPRFDYLLGKALGVILLLLLMLAFMDALMCLLVSLRESSVAADMTAILSAHGYTAEEISPYLVELHRAAGLGAAQMGILSMALGFCVLTTLTLLFSCFTSGSIVSMIFALGCYFLGMFQGQFFHALHAGIGAEGVSPAMQWAGRVCAILLPDFGLFALTDAAGSGQVISWALLGGLAAIAAGYMLLHLLVSTYIFAHKEF